jgi:hypothetical protein
MKNKRMRLLSSVMLLAGLCTYPVSAQELQVKSVGSIRTQAGQTQVMVVFTKAVDSATATDVANYTFTGGVTPTAASLLTGLPALNTPGILENPAPTGRIQDNECVILTVTGLNAGASSRITVQNVTDLDGAAITPTNRDFTDSGYTYVDVGVHPGPGKVIPIGTNGFDIFSNGRTQWAAHDQITVAYKQVSGDFNLVARVEFQDWSSRWARTGMVAREALNAGETEATQATTASRYVSIHANPVRCWTDEGGLAPGNNQWESHFRDTVGGQTASAAAGTPPYPNAWIRVARTGDTLFTYRGTNGVDWIQQAERTVTPGWNNNLFVGPSFSPETGNVNAIYGPEVQNRFFLAQIRFGAIVTPLVTSFQGNPLGFVATIEDSQTAVNPATVTVTQNGNPIPASELTTTKQGSVTTVRWASPTALPQGSVNTFEIKFSDTSTPPTQVISTQTYVANYALVPASYALAAPATTVGLVANRVHQMTAARAPGDANTTANAEMQIQNMMLDPQGQPRPNVAERAGPINLGGTDYDTIYGSPNINWEQAGSDVVGENFNSTLPAGSGGIYANSLMPGVDPGFASPPDPDNFVIETITYVNLAAGHHRWGVNSDDGFKVSVAPGQPSPAGVLLGEYNGGRGAADTLFDFLVETAGYYPIRLLYWEGGGGASCEWFSVNVNTGERTLIGDTQNNPTTAVAAYRTGQGRAYISKLSPSHRWTGAGASTPISVEIRDGRTTVSDAKLFLDGVEVATGTKQGQVTTINYTPTNPAAPGVNREMRVTYSESGQPEPISYSWSFAIDASPGSLPADSFWIEAEDFDHGGGQTVAAASTMPYAGAAYAGLLATLNVDYFDDQNDGDAGINFTYRGDARPNHVNVTDQQDEQWRVRPGNFIMTTNYRIGWVGNFWGNYTRTIPAGNYRGFAALSHGDGTQIIMEADLDRVTAGVGTTEQTLQRLGTFRGSGSGAWGSSILVPLINPSGADAVVTFPGGPVTLRATARNGDFDWFVFVPTTEQPPVDRPEFTATRRNTDGSITVEWTGGGVLQAAPDLSGPWENVPGATSPYTISPTGQRLFGRIIVP